MLPSVALGSGWYTHWARILFRVASPKDKGFIIKRNYVFFTWSHLLSVVCGDCNLIFLVMRNAKIVLQDSKVYREDSLPGAALFAADH